MNTRSDFIEPKAKDNNPDIVIRSDDYASILAEVQHFKFLIIHYFDYKSTTFSSFLFYLLISNESIAKFVWLNSHARNICSFFDTLNCI
jgi:hypothetical protein